MISSNPDTLIGVMELAVEKCIDHVETGGLPFVGVLVDDTGIISGFGFNRVRETGDPSAHAEIVAMREVLRAADRDAVARWGFDYRTSYPAWGISDWLRSTVFHHLPTENGNEPFSRYLDRQVEPGR